MMRKNVERVNNISQVSNHNHFNKNVLFQTNEIAPRLGIWTL